MSADSYEYTDLRIRKVKSNVENFENDGFVQREYFQIVDDEDNVYLEIDDLWELLKGGR